VFKTKKYAYIQTKEKLTIQVNSKILSYKIEVYTSFIKKIERHQSYKSV